MSEAANHAEGLRDTPAAPDPSRGWRESKWLAWTEVVLVAVIFYLDGHGLIPFSKTPVILLLGWISLHLRRVGWRGVGWKLWRSWPLTLAAGIAAGALMEAFELFVSQPALVRLTGKQPDLHEFQSLIGNVALALLGLLLVWTLAAFGEEMVYRGYLMNRVADLGRRTRFAWICSVLLVNAAFGYAHAYQGITGIMDEGVMGLLLGLLYLGTGGSLAVPILAHGVQDTIDLVLIFLGKYPGM